MRVCEILNWPFGTVKIPFLFSFWNRLKTPSQGQNDRSVFRTITSGKLRTFWERALEKKSVFWVISGSISSISISEVRWSCNAGLPWSSQCGSYQAASRGRKFESFWERFCDIQTRFWGCVNFYESFREFFEMMANPILRELENSQFWGGREKLVQNLVTPTIFFNYCKTSS